MTTIPYKFGWIADKPDDRDYLYAAPPPILKILPPKVDLRDKFPPVYDQGGLGSCTANAIAAALEFARKRQNLPGFTPSRLFIYYNERAMINTVAVDSGASLRDGIKSVAKLGAPPEPDWPYIIEYFAVKPPNPIYKKALKYQSLVYQRVIQNIYQLKGCIAEGFPFVFGFIVYDNFPMTLGVDTIPMPGIAKNMNMGHAVIAIGYNDAEGTFNIRNSWGEIWGDGGYGKIPYDYLLGKDLASDFWTIRLVENGSR